MKYRIINYISVALVLENISQILDLVKDIWIFLPK